jgi:hypothetical protein
MFCRETKHMNTRRLLLLNVLGISVFLSGCASSEVFGKQTQCAVGGALLGALFGGTLGAYIGIEENGIFDGGGAEGAIIGAAIAGTAGGAIGAWACRKNKNVISEQAPSP